MVFERMLKHLVGVSCVGSTLVAASGAQAAPVILDVPHVSQSPNEWCWAASTNAILKYYGHEELQTCELVTWAIDPSGNLGHNCCPQVGTSCNYKETGLGVTGILANWGIPGEVYQRALTFDEVKTEILAGHPFTATGCAHTVTVVGYDETNEQVFVMDPGIDNLANCSQGSYLGYCQYDYSTFVNTCPWGITRTTQFVNQSHASGGYTYRTENTQHLFSWDRGTPNLDVNYWWAGPVWQWGMQAMPSGESGFQGFPRAVTYQVGTGGGSGYDERDHIFIRGLSGKLWQRKWNGVAWNWVDWGKPNGSVNVVSDPAVVTAMDKAQDGAYDLERVNAFAVGSDYNLYRGVWNGSAFGGWENRSRPANVYLSSAPSAITFTEQDYRQYYAFVTNNEHLYVNFANNGNWAWGDQSVNPPAPSSVRGSPSAVMYREGRNPMIYAFVRGSNGHLLLNYWAAPFGNGAWQWSDRGAPSGTSFGSGGDPVAITFREHGIQKMYVFARAVDGRLYAHYWDPELSSQWGWVNPSGVAPSGTTVGSQPVNVVSYRENDEERIYVFFHGLDGRHYVWYRAWGQWSIAQANTLCKPANMDCSTSSECCSGQCVSGTCQ